MRLSRLLSSVAFGLVLVHSTAAFAEDDSEDAIGTTPARSRTQAAPPPASAPSGGALTVERADDEDDASRGEASRVYRGGEAPIATAPPPDWAVLHAGLRPQLGTFGGIATLALAHARTERFYGAFSLSAVRNDAGIHVGAAQIALGRNLADEFRGGMQLSLTENRSRDFIGLGQTSLAYNRGGEVIALSQVAAFNRAKSFSGGVQLGLYDRTDASFSGLAQIGAFNHSKKDFTGALQLGAFNGQGRLFDEHSASEREPRFAGIGQIGVVNSAGSFYGIAQLGAGSFVGGKFGGVVQVGALGAMARDFTGLAQIGTLVMSKKSTGLQIGAGAVSLEEHDGVQLGALGNFADDVRGAQIGIVNVADKVKGVQVGVFNHAKSLRGLQVGLANHAEDGVLPWTAILNFGFGDGDGGETSYEYRSASR